MEAAILQWGGWALSILGVAVAILLIGRAIMALSKQNGKEAGKLFGFGIAAVVVGLAGIGMVIGGAKAANDTLKTQTAGKTDALSSAINGGTTWESLSGSAKNTGVK